MKKDYFSFALARDVSVSREDIDELNNILSKVGGRARFVLEGYDGKHSCLDISFIEKRYESVTTRAAGRKRKRNYSSEYTYGDIRSWRAKGDTWEEIIKRLNCSRMTYYRRMKEAEEKNYPDDQRWRG